MRALRLLLVLLCATLIASPTFAQFPKIKLPKRPELPKKSDPLEVTRKAAPTPEAIVSLQQMVAGRATEVMLTLKNAELSAVLAVEGFSNCKVLKWEPAPPNQLKVTIQGEGGAPLDADGPNSKTYTATGFCRGEVRLKPRPALWEVRLLPDPDAAAKEAASKPPATQAVDPGAVALAQQTQVEYMKKVAASEAEAPSKLGKEWQVEFTGGKKETWTLVRGKGSEATFKTPSGEVRVAYMMGTIAVEMAKDCALMGTLKDGKIAGQVMGRTCPWEMLSAWSAVVK